ncbi:hypothetical protein G7047_11865 [Diaphorobacter sp. HDW4A]|uniref:hypothetical protein n=1 Tax=Diaphorobacter sp. HDW4A TaxID=2714924 RepID=UPI00140C17F8|nr:hypothetical protein [Diaphorobacter sp. HDW4A]QIL80521.1 hypothetical protein G7047_11865 [Diaphorobacter sp. HDW4A]
MNEVNFIYQDSGHFERRSDGVELVVIPGFNSGKICFFCDEYETIWKELRDVGVANGMQLKKSMSIKSAALVDICNQGYGGVVDLVRKFDRTTKDSNRIYLKFDKNGGSFFSYFSEVSNQVSILAKIPGFFDERVYFFSKNGDFYWNSSEDVGDISRAQFNRNYEIQPASLVSIFEHGLIDGLLSVGEYSVGKGFFRLSNEINFES